MYCDTVKKAEQYIRRLGALCYCRKAGSIEAKQAIVRQLREGTQQVFTATECVGIGGRCAGDSGSSVRRSSAAVAGLRVGERASRARRVGEPLSSTTVEYPCGEPDVHPYIDNSRKFPSELVPSAGAVSPVRYREEFASPKASRKPRASASPLYASCPLLLTLLCYLRADGDHCWISSLACLSLLFGLRYSYVTTPVIRVQSSPDFTDPSGVVNKYSYYGN